jgi:peptidoglycan/xylan/chitin deacetylase (PgdA/CDA1 family)
MQFAPLYPIIYSIIKPLFPNCLWSGDTSVPQIALTFDDGPHEQWTPQLLEVLDRYEIRASFFWLGRCVQRCPDIAKSVYERGHGIGLHGYDHRCFPLLSEAEFQQSLAKTQEAIAAACHLDLDFVQKYCRNVRPPNGVFTPKTLQKLNQWSYQPVMWSVVPEDWQRPGSAVVVSRVLKQVQNGSIVVLHDGYYGGQDVAQTTDLLLPQLIQQGYQLVTIDRIAQTMSSPDIL